jgi:hypothetical protein
MTRTKKLALKMENRLLFIQDELKFIQIPPMKKGIKNPLFSIANICANTLEDVRGVIRAEKLLEDYLDD